jgi:V8-like Glu-specific endopeptidase
LEINGVREANLTGTATLISSSIIITSAHNFYFKKYKKEATYAFFYPFAQKRENGSLQGIQIKKVKFHPNYLDDKNEYQQRHDIVLA